jgi:SMODS and SLOG-associating 2TM effector domain family 5
MKETTDNSILIETHAIEFAETEKYYAQFLSKLWVTKGCRFEANRRLARKNQASLLTISLLSIYVIAGSLTTLIAPAGSLTQGTGNVINFLLVVTSIFILVLSNIESGNNYALRAHVMLKCAQQLSELYNEIEFMLRTRTATLDSFLERVHKYDKIISDFSDNHDDIDFLCFKVSHWKHFKLDGFCAYYHTGWYRSYRFFTIWGYYLLMLIPPPLLFLIVMGKTPQWLQ